MSLDGQDVKPDTDKEKAAKAAKAKKLEDRIDALNTESNRNATIRKKEADVSSKKESGQ